MNPRNASTAWGRAEFGPRAEATVAPPSRRRSALGLILAVLLWAGVVGVASAPEADEFFDPAVVQTIRLEIRPEDLDRMHRALPKRVQVPGTFRWKDQTLHPVGVRFKGNSSSAPDSPHKRSFLISFSEFEPERRFLGLRHVALDNGIQFGSLFSERLITEVLRGVGVKASRCNFARVYVNGKPAGVYVNVERVDRSFLEHHFSSANGPLFKVDEGGLGADLRFLGHDPATYRKTFELHSGNEEQAPSALVEFLQDINSPTGSGKDLGRILDMEAFIKTTAVLLLSGAFDQYTGWGPHNYYLYQDPTDHRWTYLPWDLDVGFADQAFGRIPVLEGWHAAWPAPVPGRPLLERLLADPVLLQRYRERARVILDKWFRPEVIIPKLRALYRQIEPALAEDPYPPRRATVPSDSDFEGILASMERFMRDRYALAQAQLDEPGHRPTPRPMLSAPEQDGSRPGPPSEDAPSDLRAVKITLASVELQWTDHAEGEVAFVVQRCSGEEGIDFVNSIGQGGSNLTTAIDRQVQPGKTYRYRVYAVLPTPQGPRGTGVSSEITVVIPEKQPAQD